MPSIEAALRRGAKGKIITSTYQNFTDIPSLRTFCDLKRRYPSKFDAHLDYDSFLDGGFHCKGYFFEYENGQCELLIGSSNLTSFALLKNIDKNEAELMERANRLSKIETEVDNIYRREISRIFAGDMELLDIIRWKDILGTLEDTSDKVEQLGNVIKEVTMKYA